MLEWLPRLYSNRQPRNLAIYLALLSIVAIAAFAFRIPYIYAVVFIFASTWYGVVSRRLIDAGAMSLDAIATSELVIACGIASLLLHVVIAGVHISDELVNGREFSEQTVRAAVLIFSEGLICAAVAPVIAVVIRVLEGRERAAAGISSPSDVGKILEEFAKRSAGMAQNMERLSNAIAVSAERYEGAALRASTALEALATDIQAKADGVGLELSALQSQAKVFGSSMADATTEVRKAGVEASTTFGAINDSMQSLGKRLDEFSDKARSGSALLDGLRELISSVNRFIRPHTTDDPVTKLRE
jgi:hypothetical protein